MEKVLRLKVFFLISFLSISFVLILVSNYKRELPIEARERSYFFVESFQRFSFNLKTELTRFIGNIYQAEKLRKENQILKEKIDKLTFREENYYREILSANERLKKMLEFKKRQAFKLIPVEVIAYSPFSYFDNIFIGKGKEKGIEKNMVVVNAKGLVGRIIEVYPHQAKILTILDKRSKVGVRDENTRDIAILQGKGEEEKCELIYLSNKVSIKVGDKVITSGLGGVFPKGILVGEISLVKKNPYRLFQYVEVRPYVDFRKLEELLVVKE
ncbi:MAG: rod shape-determining protein MreC [Candidatus Aerophobetes bacterium]|nr:rod shape-determining protein MreC [Candidatus Aerophobetes bacterium]